MTERDGSVDYLPIIREGLGKPSREEVALVLSSGGFVEKYVHRSAPPTLEEKQKNLDNLRLIKTQFEQKGFASSRAAVCAAFLFLVRDRFRTQAEEMLIEKRIEPFRFYYDYTIGFSAVVIRIDEAANRGQDRIEREITRSATLLPDVLELQTSTSEEAELYLSIKADVTKSAELLEKDPTGFLLIDRVIDDYRQGGEMKGTNVCIDYVVAGAELARDLYKQAYEIAAPLYPDKPQN